MSGAPNHRCRHPGAGQHGRQIRAAEGDGSQFGLEVGHLPQDAPPGPSRSDSERSGPVIVGEGVRIVRSRITGPVVIGAGTVIEDSTVGAFASIGSGCRPVDAAVADSILLDQASVHGVGTLHGSIIGRAGDVRRREDGSATHRLLVGDDSRIDVPV